MFGFGCDDERVVYILNVVYYAVVCKGRANRYIYREPLYRYVGGVRSPTAPTAISENMYLTYTKR